VFPVRKIRDLDCASSSYSQSLAVITESERFDPACRDFDAITLFCGFGPKQSNSSLWGPNCY